MLLATSANPNHETLNTHLVHIGGRAPHHALVEAVAVVRDAALHLRHAHSRFIRGSVPRPPAPTLLRIARPRAWQDRQEASRQQPGPGLHACMPHPPRVQPSQRRAASAAGLL